MKVATVIYFDFTEKYQCKEAGNIAVSVDKDTTLEL